jgi:hypothetical protein
MTFDKGTYGLYGAAATFVASGTTFAPSMITATPFGVPGHTGVSGVMSIMGALQFASTTSGGAASTLSINVANASGVAGSSYTQFAVYSAPTAGAGNGSITSADSATNPLADANLVVNIAPNLSKANGSVSGVHGMADLGVVGVDPFASEALTILSAAGTTFNSNSAFAKVTIVGGFATVNYTSTGVTLTNIFSSPSLPGDINDDGLVDVADYDVWAANVGATGANWLQGDLNGDGLVDVADYDIWAANVGQTSATPEPISMIILAIGGGLVALKRRNG